MIKVLTGLMASVERVLGSLCLTILTLVAIVPVGQAAVNQPEQQFDFLIGEHDVTLHAWTGSGWTPPRPVNAQWNGWRGLQDAAIYDEWFDPQAGSGVNVRMYDPDEKIWKMMWIATGVYQVQDLRAQLQQGVLRMWQIHPERPGWHADFEVLSACSWARADFQADESGEPQPRFRLVATKKDCQSD